MHVLVPSSEAVSGREALRSVLANVEELDAAVAFVTSSGVKMLGELLAESGAPATFRMVVRGGPVSDPDAVIALADLGAEVRVVMGTHAARFHPKLWISTTAGWARVLSGSGNLTAGGLNHNYEQFELLSLRLPDYKLEAAAHHERWNAFFALGSPLAEAMASPAWAEWTAQQSRRRELASELRKLDERLTRSAPPAPAGEDLRWLKTLLEDAMPGDYAAEMSPRVWGERVQVDVGEGRGVRYVFLRYGEADDGRRASLPLELAIYPGDTLTQARQLYPKMTQEVQNRIVELEATSGWSVRPNFHLGFRNRGWLHDNQAPADLTGYLEYWRSHIGEHHQRSAEEWPTVLGALASEQVVSPGYPQRFSDEVGHRARLHPCPGLLIVRQWPRREVDNLARDEKLTTAVRTAADHALAVIGEPPLQT